MKPKTTTNTECPICCEGDHGPYACPADPRADEGACQKCGKDISGSEPFENVCHDCRADDGLDFSLDAMRPTLAGLSVLGERQRLEYSRRGR